MIDNPTSRINNTTSMIDNPTNEPANGRLSERQVRRALVVLSVMQRHPELRFCGWIGEMPVLELDRLATRHDGRTLLRTQPQPQLKIFREKM